MLSSPFFFTSLSNSTFVVNIKDTGTINHNVYNYLLVVVVAVQGLLEGLFGLSLELLRPASSRDADIGTFWQELFGKTVHDGS